MIRCGWRHRCTQFITITNECWRDELKLEAIKLTFRLSGWPSSRRNKIFSLVDTKRRWEKRLRVSNAQTREWKRMHNIEEQIHPTSWLNTNLYNINLSTIKSSNISYPCENTSTKETTIMYPLPPKSFGKGEPTNLLLTRIKEKLIPMTFILTALVVDQFQADLCTCRLFSPTPNYCFNGKMENLSDLESACFIRRLNKPYTGTYTYVRVYSSSLLYRKIKNTNRNEWDLCFQFSTSSAYAVFLDSRPLTNLKKKILPQFWKSAAKN